eukprot:scaffold7358_cov252-Pinguiococcus_pyrenoidosus.AAC.18
MVELHQWRVLEEVAIPRLDAGLKEWLQRQPGVLRHLGKAVVRAPGVVAGHKPPAHGRDEGGDAKAHHRPAKPLRGGQGLRSRPHERCHGVLGRSASPSRAAVVLVVRVERRVEQQRVGRERHPQVGREPVRRDANLLQVRLRVHLQARLDHPPAHQPLRPTHGKEHPEARPKARGETPAGDEVAERQREGQANEAAEHAVPPLPVVDELELLKRHAAFRSAGKRG